MKRSIYLLIGGLALASNAAYAEMIQGTIASVDPSRSQFSIQPMDTSKDVQHVEFKDTTRTKNLLSPQNLQVGQEVKVDVKKRSGDLLEAKSIELTNAQSAQNSPASQSSDSEPSSAGGNKTAQY